MHIIILGGYSSAHQKLKERLACQLTLLTKTSALKEKYKHRYDHVLALKDVDEALWVALGLVMGRRYPATRVVTFDDDYHGMAQAIAKGLNIPYLYGEKTLELVTSKPKLRQYLYEAGKHYIYGITEKHKDEHFVEMGHVVPAPLSALVAGRIKAYTKAVLTQLGVTDGPMHTEVIVTPTGVELVETQARVGGDMINELHSEALGVDLLGEIMEGMVTGRKAATFQRLIEKSPECYAAIAFGRSGAGRVKKIDVPGDIEEWPGYLGYRIWRREQEIANDEHSSIGRISQAWARGATPQIAWERAQKLLSAITITYEPIT